MAFGGSERATTVRLVTLLETELSCFQSNVRFHFLLQSSSIISLFVNDDSVLFLLMIPILYKKHLYTGRREEHKRKMSQEVLFPVTCSLYELPPIDEFNSREVLLIIHYQ